MQKLEQPRYLAENQLELIYSFIYRLSGNRKTAEMLTTKVFLKNRNVSNNELFLLKQAWSSYNKDYQSFETTAEETVQQSLLALAPGLRCTLILRDVLGYSKEEIAAIIEKSENEVSHFVAQGRCALTRMVKCNN